MKTPALPTRISSIFAFLWMLFLAAIALLTLYTLLFTARSHAGTIVYGGQNFSNGVPFGFTDQGTALYVGRYQQIYEKFRFPAAQWGVIESGNRGPVGSSSSSSSYSYSYQAGGGGRRGGRGIAGRVLPLFTANIFAIATPQSAIRRGWDALMEWSTSISSLDEARAALEKAAIPEEWKQRWRK